MKIRKTNSFSIRDVEAEAEAAEAEVASKRA